MGIANGVTISIVLFGIGLVGLVLRRDLVIKLLALGLLNSATILCLVSLGATPDGAPPILSGPASDAIVDPLPQALVLSAIVINFAILALALVFVMLLVERYHTTDSQRIDRETNAEEETWN
jgi:multicomponent Na+:H+ antiporter subunit C